jgi:hypothetical protein
VRGGYLSTLWEKKVKKEYKLLKRSEWRIILLFIALALISSVLDAINTWDASIEYLSLIERIENDHRQHQRIDIGDIRMGKDYDNYSPSPFREKHWLFYDSKNLYYAVIAEIDSSFSRGVEAVRDGNTASDNIYLQLITQPESNLAYVYGFSPLGCKMDYTIDYSFGSNYNWDSSYQYKSELHNNLWFIEATIPFNDLRYSGAPPYEFSVMFKRTHYKSMSYYRYPYVDSKIGLDYFRSFYPITIETHIEHQWNPKLKLHSTMVYDLQEEQTNDLADYTGLNFSLKPGQNSTAKLTIQPDFSDTPLDSESNVYNSKYPPTIEENRSFFIEDYDLLAPNADFWYTRKIISPIIALKFNRIQNNSALAVLALKDKENSDVMDSGDYWLAAGYSNNVGNNQVIFNAYTRGSEDWADYNSLVYLITGIRPGKNILVNPEFGFSFDHKPSTDKVGTYGKLAIAWQGEHFYLMGGSEYLSRDFTASMGSINETDRANLVAQIEYQKYFDTYLNYLTSQLTMSTTYNLKFDTNYYRSLIFSTSATGFNNVLTLSYNTDYSEEYFSYIMHSTYAHTLGLSSSKYQYLMPSASFTSGKSIIYSQNRTADYFSFVPTIWTEINQNTTLGLGIYYIKYNAKQTDVFDNEYYFSNINLKTQFVDKISITQGIRINNYTNTMVPASDVSSAIFKNGYIGYYVNIDWMVTKHFNLITGYKSIESRYRMDEERELAVEEQNMYLKVEYQF